MYTQYKKRVPKELPDPRDLVGEHNSAARNNMLPNNSQRLKQDALDLHMFKPDGVLALREKWTQDPAPNQEPICS